MTFTNDDLKQLKKSENALQRSLGLPALIARLETAESLVEELVTALKKAHKLLLENDIIMTGNDALIAKVEGKE